MDRETVDFCTDWKYINRDDRAFARRECDERAFLDVSLPHANVELPHHNFDDREYQFVSWYRRHFHLPAKYRGRCIFLDFEGVMIACDVFVNGRKAGSQKGGYTPFFFDITPYVENGKDNVLAVRVDSRERKDIPPCGGNIDYLTFGGIYREVRLRVTDEVHISGLSPRPRKVLGKKQRLDLTLEIANFRQEPTDVRISASLIDARGKKVASAGEMALVQAESHAWVDMSMKGFEAARWDIDKPNLYTVRADIYRKSRKVDSLSRRVGFRKAVFKKNGFYLNGRRVNLIGLNRHQTFPYIGGAAPARLQRRDAEILKDELGINIVRTSHYPQSRHFLDRCDELGLLVFEEIPGWQHIGDEAWKTLSKRDVSAMIRRDRHHPSIVLWGVRINESPDDDEFYAETNRIAHELDPTRQTGGVRCFRESNFLEDVFTYNDFAYDLTEPNHTPYLVTEFCGHMYPTKPFDQEERLIEHAVRHVHKQNMSFGRKDVCGAIGWCAFDYNTHYNFGSGDRICYHGVSDIFRIPKFAAWFYASQMDPSRKVVLFPATMWKIGERSGGGIRSMLVFTNCDYVTLESAGRKYGPFKPDRKRYRHLPHPPVSIDRNIGAWGKDWAGLRVEGFIGGKRAAVFRLAADGIPRKLRASADHKRLHADGADMTRIEFGLTDRFGNYLPYVNNSVRIECSGPALIVGENPFCLVGGRGAVFLRAGRKSGTARVKVSCPGFDPVELNVKIR